MIEAAMRVNRDGATEVHFQGVRKRSWGCYMDEIRDSSKKAVFASELSIRLRRNKSPSSQRSMVESPSREALSPTVLVVYSSFFVAGSQPREVP
ncbi:hypothetical protein ACH5RR_008562 [Cinchona calisaya]|uniref:Uncharacterized protein n=1 Tax=Cinchona calisaya TaxID=153742 RepID=A0ABD3AFC4_9GENT